MPALEEVEEDEEDDEEDEEDEEGEGGDEAEGGSEEGGGSEEEEDEELADLQLVLQLVLDEEDESDETMEELRFLARTRLGPGADSLHPSWGASSVDELPPDRLRSLCLMVLAQESVVQ